MSILNRILWLTCFVFCFCGCWLNANAINYPECANVEHFNTFVASQKSCAKYIFCDGENSFEGECLGDNYFNEVKGNCDDRSAVYCRIQGSNGGEGEGDEAAAAENGSFNNVDGVNGNHIENNHGGNNGNINNENDNDSSVDVDWNVIETENEKPLIDDQNNNIVEEPGLFNPVPIPNLPIDFIQAPYCATTLGTTKLMHFANPTSCSAYYTCYNGIAIPMICARNQYFNAQSGRCEPQENVECLLNRPLSLQCIKGVYDFIPHPKNCEYYYFCSNGFLMIFQCPNKYNWDYERKTCVVQSKAKCFSSSVRQEMIFA